MAEQLKREGHSVIGVDAFTDYYDPTQKRATAAELLAEGIETREVDLVTADLSASIPADTEFILHFAAQPGIAADVTFETYERNNMLATARLLAYANTLPKLSGFIYVSTSSVYGVQAVGMKRASHAQLLYGVTKLGAEQLTLSYARRVFFQRRGTTLFRLWRT